MAILVIAEHDNAALKAATLNTVAAAQKIGGDIHVLVAGSACQAAAQAAAQLQGVAAVKVADAAHYAAQTAENLTALVIAQAAGYSHILAPATTFGKNLAPRVAALLDVAQISEITAVEAADTFVRPIYAGNALATVQSADKIKVITVRTTAFDAVATGGSAAIEAIAPATVQRVTSRIFTWSSLLRAVEILLFRDSSCLVKAVANPSGFAANDSEREMISVRCSGSVMVPILTDRAKRSRSCGLRRPSSGFMVPTRVNPAGCETDTPSRSTVFHPLAHASRRSSAMLSGRRFTSST